MEFKVLKLVKYTRSDIYLFIIVIIKITISAELAKSP